MGAFPGYEVFFFSSRRRHTRWPRDWSSDVCSSDLAVRFVSIFTNDDSGTCSPVIGDVRRSEERRVGKECRARGSAYQYKKEAYSSSFVETANHSVRVNDDFMRAVVEAIGWWTNDVH